VSDLLPRLLRREQAAAYLGISIAALDQLRTAGEITVVPVPSRFAGRATRVPLYDRMELDAAIERWKAGVVKA
jgi:hypothetical protein